MKITFLGTGTSHGVPLIGCHCKTCNSSDHRNKRNRSSIFIEIGDISFLIDTPQELRLQLLKNNISKFNAVLYTHPHADHILGLDDLRSINRITDQKVSCFGNEFTIKEIKQVFHYIFEPVQIGGGLPQISLKIVNKSFKIDGIRITPLPVKHGKLDILGYRIGNIAYITDCSYIPKKTLDLMVGVRLLILGALRYRKHSTHMNIDEAIDIIKKIQPLQAFLTHLSHDIEYTSAQQKLPPDIYLAYDGLEVEIQEEK